MVAAKDQRHHVLIERLFHRFRQALAGLGNLVEVFCVLLAVVLLFGLGDGDVADVFDLAAQLLQARLGDRRRAAQTDPCRRLGG